MSRQTPVLVFALVAALVVVARSSRAADACIPQKVIDALADCSAVASLPVLPAVNPFQIGAPPQGLPGSGKAAKQAGTSKLAPRDLDAAEKALEGACHRFACENKPAAGDAKARQFFAETEYVRARTYFGAQHWQEAAALSGVVARERFDTPVGIYATQLYLEALNILGSLVESPSCYDDLARDVPVFIGLYCKGDRAAANAEMCGVLSRIQRDILRLDAEKHVKAGDRLGPDGDAEYEAGADKYLAVWERHGKDACEAKRSGCERAEEILYNAARAYQAAHLPWKAIAARKVLVDPRYHLHHTELAKKALYELGGAYQAMGIYDEAASWYETFAQAHKSADKAHEALLDAVVLRLGLGQTDQAVKDADLFNKNYGSARPALTAAVAFAIGAHHVEKEDFREARKRLTSAMGQIDRNATVDVQIQAHALLGRVFVKLDSAPDAATEYSKVRGFWKDPFAVVKKILEDDDNRKLGKVLTALGEALFFFAEEKRRAVDALRLPVHRGSGREEDITDYLGNTLRAWLVEKRKAIDEAEKAYVEILSLQPSPPPRWVVAASARVARMHGKLAAELRAAPMPAGWKKQGPSPFGWTWDEIFVRWHASLDAASEPLLQQAKGSHRRCVDLAVKLQHGVEHARACAAWLSRHYPAEYPRLDEIADRPSHRAFASEFAPVPEPVKR